MFTPYKMDYKSKNSKKKSYVTIKGSKHKENITIIGIYEPIIRDLNIKQILTDMREIYKMHNNGRF